MQPKQRFTQAKQLRLFQLSTNIYQESHMFQTDVLTLSQETSHSVTHWQTEPIKEWQGIYNKQ
jgi:hypothetical protein